MSARGYFHAYMHAIMHRAYHSCACQGPPGATYFFEVYSESHLLHYAASARGIRQRDGKAHLDLALDARDIISYVVSSIGARLSAPNDTGNDLPSVCQHCRVNVDFRQLDGCNERREMLSSPTHGTVVLYISSFCLFEASCYCIFPFKVNTKHAARTTHLNL